MEIIKKTAITLSSGLSFYFLLAQNAFAQFATEEAAPKGGTSGALPNAGSTNLTYFLLIGGLILFVFGTIKLIESFKEAR